MLIGKLIPLLLIAPTAWSQLSLDWGQAVDLVSEQNPELKGQALVIESREAQQGVARSGFMPQLSANVARNRSGSDAGATTDNYSTSLSGSWNLFAGLADAGKLEQAENETLSQRATLEIIRARLSFELRSAFSSLAYARDYLKLTAEIIHRREENMRLVELRFESGRENKGSVYLSQAYLGQAKYDRLQAENSERVSRANLARVLGLDEAAELSIQGEAPVSAPQTTFPTFQELAVGTPDFKQAQAQVGSTAAGVQVARAQFFPKLDLSGSMTHQEEDFFPDQNKRWSTGITLSLPFFTGGRDYYATSSAIALRSQAQRNRENVSRALLAKLEQAFASYREAAAKFEVDLAFQKAATARAEISRKKYNNGLLTFEDWDVIENDLINRQKSYLQSKRDRAIAEGTWEQAQGKGVLP